MLVGLGSLHLNDNAARVAVIMVSGMDHRMTALERAFQNGEVRASFTTVARGI